jgi:hypothetical protein
MAPLLPIKMALQPALLLLGMKTLLEISEAGVVFNNPWNYFT